MTFFSAIFGEQGTATIIFSGLWWLVAVFILMFFVLYLVGAGISAENIMFFSLSFFLLSIAYGLFAIPIELILLLIILIGMFISNYVYYYFYKPD